MPLPMPLPVPSKAARAALLLLAALTLVPGMGTTAAAQPDPAAVADQVRRHGDYADRLPVADSDDLGSATFTFPGGASGEGGGSGAGDPALRGEEGEDEEHGAASERPRSERRRSRDTSTGVPLASGGGSILLWIGIVALIAVFVFVLASLRPRGGALADAPSRDRDGDTPAAPPGLTVVAGDPDDLAAAGRYEAAIAALLLAALREVGWRPEGLMRTRTAREILASVGARDARHPPLAALVAIQERVAFAGVEADEAKWRDAQAHFRALESASEASA